MRPEDDDLENAGEWHILPPLPEQDQDSPGDAEEGPITHESFRLDTAGRTTEPEVVSLDLGPLGERGEVSLLSPLDDVDADAGVDLEDREADAPAAKFGALSTSQFLALDNEDCAEDADLELTDLVHVELPPPPENDLSEPDAPEELGPIDVSAEPDPVSQLATS